MLRFGVGRSARAEVMGAMLSGRKPPAPVDPAEPEGLMYDTWRTLTVGDEEINLVWVTPRELGFKEGCLLEVFRCCARCGYTPCTPEDMRALKAVLQEEGLGVEEIFIPYDFGEARPGQARCTALTATHGHERNIGEQTGSIDVVGPTDLGAILVMRQSTL